MPVVGWHFVYCGWCYRNCAITLSIVRTEFSKSTSAPAVFDHCHKFHCSGHLFHALDIGCQQER